MEARIAKSNPLYARHGFNLHSFFRNNARRAMISKKPIAVPRVLVNKSSTSHMPVPIASCSSSIDKDTANPAGIVLYHLRKGLPNRGSNAPRGRNMAMFSSTLLQLFTE